MPQSWIVLSDDDLTSTQKLVYYCLCRFQGDHEDCFPSHKTIAKECKLGRNTVKRAIEVLIKWRYIEKIPQKRPDDGKSSNRYKCLK